MARFHLIRVGALGAVGRFAAIDGAVYRRRDAVVVRTVRGLELGEVVAPPVDDEPRAAGDGPLLRRVSVQDELLRERLQRDRHAAFEACRLKLAEIDSSAALVDAEITFDGRSLYFYFLGETDAAVEAATSELAAAYDAESHIGRFADTLAAGCGPDCGEKEGGCGDCGGGCPVASACGR